MPALILLSRNSEKTKQLSQLLVQQGYTCSIIRSVSESDDSSWNSVKLVVVDMSTMSEPDKQNVLTDINYVKNERHLAVIGIISRKMVSEDDIAHLIDDFIIAPVNVNELVLRIKKLLAFKKTTIKAQDILNYGDLVIDTAQCEVTVDGNPIPLTFKEYELLKFLAKNKGRVYSREALLNEVWGFDYYGGDRTVDVHIRRLRSKIEIGGHTFVDTVRNIGYKFINGS